MAHTTVFTSPRRTGQEKAAMLLASLGNPLAVNLLQKLDPDDVKAIMSSAEQLGPLNRDDLQPLVEEFSQSFAKALGIKVDSEQMRLLLDSAFSPEQVETMLKGEDPEHPAPVWPRLQVGMEAKLVPYLLDEHPQTAAAIVSHLDPDLAARAISMLPRDHRVSIITRMLKLAGVAEPVSRLVQDCLRQDLLGRAEETSQGDARLKIATLMNKLSNEETQEILDILAATRPDEVKALRALIFAFEDISKLDPSHRLKLFDKLVLEQVILALRGTTADFRAMVLASLSARSRRMAEAELSSNGDQPLKGSAAARRAIADAAIVMAANGEIKLPDPDAAEQPSAAPPPEAASEAA